MINRFEEFNLDKNIIKSLKNCNKMLDKAKSQDYYIAIEITYD